MTIPVTGRYADVQLKIFSNTAATAAQVAEFQVIGAPAPNPDLTVTDLTWAPAHRPRGTRSTVSATVRNTGSAASAATTVNVSLDGAARVGAGGHARRRRLHDRQGPHRQAAKGSYTVSAVVDPAGHRRRAGRHEQQPDRVGRNWSSGRAPDPTWTVTAHHLQPGELRQWARRSPSRSRSTTAAQAVSRPGPSHASPAGNTTLNGTAGAIAAGASVTVDDRRHVDRDQRRCHAHRDGRRDEHRRGDQREQQRPRALPGGRTRCGGARTPSTKPKPPATRARSSPADAKRTFGHTNFATESSGRQSVRLTTTGHYVEFTSASAANSIVVRNSIPDAPRAAAPRRRSASTSTTTSAAKLHPVLQAQLAVRKDRRPRGPDQHARGTDARRLFDESHALLSQSYPHGTKFRLQRDAGDTASFYIVDLIDLEQVAPPAPSRPAAPRSRVRCRPERRPRRHRRHPARRDRGPAG